NDEEYSRLATRYWDQATRRYQELGLNPNLSSQTRFIYEFMHLVAGYTSTLHTLARQGARERSFKVGNELKRFLQEGVTFNLDEPHETFMPPSSEMAMAIIERRQQ